MDSVETNTTRTGSLITLDVLLGLPPKRLWNGTVLACGCQDHPVLSNVQLSELLHHDNNTNEDDPIIIMPITCKQAHNPERSMHA